MDHNTNWWHGPVGHVYFNIVDDLAETPEDGLLFEIAARNVIDPKLVREKRFSWGVPATNERVLSHFTVSSYSWHAISASYLLKDARKGL